MNFYATLTTMNRYPAIRDGYPSFRVSVTGYGHSPSGFTIFHDQLGPRLSAAVRKAIRSHGSLDFWDVRAPLDWRYNTKTAKWRLEISR